MNVNRTDWDRMTPFEDTVDQQTKVDISLPVESKLDQQMFIPRSSLSSCCCCSWALKGEGRVVGHWQNLSSEKCAGALRYSQRDSEDGREALGVHLLRL